MKIGRNLRQLIRLCGAAALLCERVEPVTSDEDEPADRLAADLTVKCVAGIGEWGARHGFVRETLSRQFRQLYGIDASAYRAEARARRAWRMIVGTSGLAWVWVQLSCA